jgi:hypothetical protein
MEEFEEAKLYAECTCQMEVLGVEYDKDIDIFFLGIYRMSEGSNLIQRLRHIWRIIKTGRPYGDDIVLNRETASKLARYLSHPSRDSLIESLTEEATTLNP